MSNATANLASYEYSLGAAGNRTSVREQGGRFVTYSYDDNYRLITESVGNDPAGYTYNGVASYTYDAVGNRLTKTSSISGGGGLQNNTFDNNDRLEMGASYYDNNGNTVYNNSNKYDFENRLTNYSSNYVRLNYDGDGNLVGKTFNNTTTNYLVDINNHTGYSQIVEEINNGVVSKQFTYGNDLISQRIISNNQISFYQYDGHGSVRQLTNAAGTITDRYTYDAFGLRIHGTESTDNDYRYAGERYDSHLQFYYLRARYMNPQIGRFLSMDSYEGINEEPITLHKYLYANADPANKIDPSGNITVGQIMGVIIGVSIIAALATAAYNSYGFGYSHVSNEPIIEIDDQLVIVEGSGWDYNTAVNAHSSASESWKREANIIVKQLPPIIISGCDQSGNCLLNDPALRGDGTVKYLGDRLNERGINSKHATFFVNDIKPSQLGYSIPGYTPLNSGFIYVGQGAISMSAVWGTMSWSPGWMTVAHEWGHTFLGEGHTPGGLMHENLANPWRIGRYLTNDQKIKARQGAMKYK